MGIPVQTERVGTAFQCLNQILSECPHSGSELLGLRPGRDCGHIQGLQKKGVGVKEREGLAEWLK
jgi:hypothetical protein